LITEAKIIKFEQIAAHESDPKLKAPLRKASRRRLSQVGGKAGRRNAQFLAAARNRVKLFG